MIVIRELLFSLESKGFHRYTYPVYRLLLNNLGVSSSVIAVGVECSEVPIGLALGKGDLESGVVTLFSIYVSESHKGWNLERDLLIHFEKVSLLNKYKRVETVFIERENNKNPLRTVCNELLWDDFTKKMLFYTYRARDFFQLKWMNKVYNRKELEIPFLKDVDCKKLEKECPDDLNPFKNDLSNLAFNSSALVYRNEVIGWLAVHEVEPGVLRYSNLWIKDKYQRKGWFIPLLKHCIHKQLEFIDNYPKMLQGIPFQYQEMIYFAKRKLAPISTGSFFSWKSGKQLIG